MPEAYYELQGWDREKGWPTRERLEQLGLKEVAEELGQMGRLPRGTPLGKTARGSSIFRTER